MTTTYKILFMVELLHDFYRNGQCTDFRIVPSTETAALLRNCKAMYKMTGNKLVVLIKTDTAGKPFIQPSATDKFTFYMELMKPLFITVSNIDASLLSNKRFYFSNLYNNKAVVAPGNELLYLSQPITAFAGAVNYKPGEFAAQAGTVYESIKTSTGVTPPDTTNWVSRNKNQYATKEDMLQFISTVHTFTTAPATSIQVQLFALNTATNMFDVIVFDKTVHYQTNVEAVAVDLSHLSKAKYKAVVNGTEQFVYISNEAVFNNLFAVIELYNHLPNGNDFSFFDAGGFVKDKIVAAKNVWLHFSVRFANRLAFWKYIATRKGIQAIDSNPSYSFAGNDNPADYFVSNIPVPLQETPHDFKLTLFQPISPEPPPAPNPDVHASGMLTKSGNDYYCNIYLNY
ncbi:hypothetical protein ESA94_16990 [Lacibacter luteus]|uniref:Uncharacterized protein n=1 Tax=Lacibacter luteus TaxID=2508719 RepID=A0A4Q1CEM0_9BACT|nr:hypothetical protein [Lacibacter luteus]RXK58338.1 hypothetical protein ESA94_16990 [Lacibacter luteus]